MKKEPSKKSTVTRLLTVVAVCLAVVAIYVMFNRSTKRAPTAGEISAHEAYAVDWSTIPGWEAGMTEKEFILNLSSYLEEKEIGSNVHKIYTSDVLPEYLYRCHEITEITTLNETLYISYNAEDEDMVILAYSDEGLTELAVYDHQTDTLYHEINGETMVWTKFRKGFQFGEG